MLQSTKLLGPITSVCPSFTGKAIYVGTSQSVLYLVNYNFQLDTTVLHTCHPQRINAIAFPSETDEIIATCSINDIRLWNLPKSKELVRIQVPNLECNCVTFSPNGKMIVSGWSDGRVRAFGPQSGKLIFVINDAHKLLLTNKDNGQHLGVTSLAISKDNQFLVTGGSDGNVRVWDISKGTQPLLTTLKEHKGTVNYVSLKDDMSEALSASDDGSCIIWDLKKNCRSNIITQQTYFKSGIYLPDFTQILTAGSDRKITYYDAFDCNEIRVLEGSDDEIHALDISKDSKMFASGGADKKVKLWGYDAGEVLGLGEGHSGNVNCVKFSPSQNIVVSCGSEGAIFVWSVKK